MLVSEPKDLTYSFKLHRPQVTRPETLQAKICTEELTDPTPRSDPKGELWRISKPPQIRNPKPETKLDHR